MTQLDTVTEQIEAIRQESIKVIEKLSEKRLEFELAEPRAALDLYREKLRENTYKVLVVGEAKRGKSTFVNALVGRDILPTDVDVATSQVFNISPSQEEAYRLRFEDGSAREIPLEDLPRYGSQVVADAEGPIELDQIVRWIEVDAPVRFLPEGISILDTPGLGALYAAHARITHRFVPEADAVVFVLDSGQPLVQAEIAFIENILEVTRSIFFIQTKIDQHNKDDWQDVQRRNQEILEERFGGRLTDTRVWPVSSTNLQKAASAEGATGEAYLMVSRHKELATALKAFLERVAGWSRSAEAMLVAEQYHATSRKALAGRLAGFAEESKQARAELQKDAMENKRRFEEEWGPQGQKYRELREGLQQAIQVGKRSFSDFLQMGSDIELVQKEKIEAVKSLAEANKVAKEMPGEVVAAATKAWTRVCTEVQSRCVELLGPFAEAADEAGTPLDTKLPHLAMGGREEDRKFKHDYLALFRGAAGGGLLMMGLNSLGSFAGLGGAAAGAAATGGLVIAPYIFVPALVLVTAGTIGSVSRGQVNSAKGQLKMQLAEVLQKVRRYFFDVDLASANFSRVDEYFRELERATFGQVQEMVRQKSQDAAAEISRLNESIKLDDQQREARAREIREQLAEWDKLGKSVRDVMSQIKKLEESGVGAAPAPR